MVALNDAVRRAITAGRLAHLVTIVHIAPDRVAGPGPWQD